MTNVVWKYLIESGFECLSIPRDAKLLSCQMKNNKICLWFLINVENKNNLQARIFRVFYTGEPFAMKEDLKYVATVKSDFNVVYHVFEVIS
jgi:hypothetical protein